MKQAKREVCSQVQLHHFSKKLRVEMKVTSVQTWKGTCLAEISRKRKAGNTSEWSRHNAQARTKRKKKFSEGLTAVYMKICTSWSFPLYSTLHCLSWMLHTTAVLCYTVGTYARSHCPSWLSVITIIIQAYLWLYSSCTKKLHIVCTLPTALMLNDSLQKKLFTNCAIHGCVVII